MNKRYQLAALPGEGIGPEVVQAKLLFMALRQPD